MSVRALVRRQSTEGEPLVWPAVGETLPGAQRMRPPGPAEKALHEVPNAGEPDLAAVRQAAFREGEAAGRAQTQAEVRPVLEQLSRTAKELAALRPRLREQAEEDLIRLAVAIARRVVRRELTVDPQTITGLVKAALEQLAAGETARLRVHPEHEAIVRGFLADAGRGSITVIADGALARGSAVFETARGDLDASAETQLAEIERGLTDRFRSSR
ncbi:MAG TPA: FliH/SctL family protein [Bryobacteraceae bacterium]|nr:FliH/SctL family protein [Bryobacteraceae bacterium]